MHRMQPRADVAEDGQCLVEVKSAVRHDRGQGRAVHELHDDRRLVRVVQHRVEDLDDVGMADRRSTPRLVTERGDRDLVAEQMWCQQFHGDDPVERAVAGTQHATHATDADLVEQFVPPREDVSDVHLCLPIGQRHGTTAGSNGPLAGVDPTPATHEETAMPTATWNGAVLAQSDETVVVEGNHYFPPDSVNRDLFEEVDQTSVCPWKGTASYYDVVVDGDRNAGAAWYYPQPKDAAAEIKDHVAFWKGVEVSD